MTRSPAVLIMVLAAIVGLIFLMVRPGGEEHAEESEVALIAGLDTASVDDVTIRNGPDVTELSRTGRGWVIATDDSFPADRMAVDRLLRETMDLTGDEVASRVAEKHERFEVDSTSAVEVAVRAVGGTVGRFFVGKEGPGRMSQYVRLAGQEEVLLEPSRLRDVYVRPGDGWRNKTIIEVEHDEIQTIELDRRGGEVVVFEADMEDNWKVVKPEGFEPVKPLVVAMGRVLTRLTASGFPDEDEEGNEGFDDPEVVVKATLFNGTAYTLEIGRERDDKPGWFARKGGDDIVYVVPSSRINNFIRPAEELMTPAVADTAAADTAAAESGEGAVE